MLLCRQLSDCSEPLIFPARATLKARRGYELFREALVWPRRTRRSRLRVFVGMHSRSSETGLCSSPAAQQASSRSSPRLARQQSGQTSAQAGDAAVGLLTQHSNMLDAGAVAVLQQSVGRLPITPRCVPWAR